jgi:hypothetical protein
MTDSGETKGTDTFVRWAFIENIAIYLAIATITLGGILLTGTFYGLWSLILVLCLNNVKIRAKSHDR